MLIALYYYDEFELSNKKENSYVDDAVQEDEQCQPINQTMRPLVPKFKDVSGSTHMKCYGRVLNHRNLS